MEQGVKVMAVPLAVLASGKLSHSSPVAHADRDRMQLILAAVLVPVFVVRAVRHGSNTPLIDTSYPALANISAAAVSTQAQAQPSTSIVPAVTTITSYQTSITTIEVVQTLTLYQPRQTTIYQSQSCAVTHPSQL